jgi:hypothetical protein
LQLAKLAKLARGVASIDEALELLSTMGIEVQASPAIDAEHDNLVAQLVGAVHDAERDGGVRGIYRLNANLKGLPVRAIVVVSNPPAEVIEQAAAEAGHAVESSA